MIANSFNRQFTTFKLGKHSSSRMTRQVVEGCKADVSRGIRIVSPATRSPVQIKSCRSGMACGPDSLSIFHLNNLGPLAAEHLTTLYNDSLKSCRLPSICKISLVIPIPKPGKDSTQGTSCRPISLLCPRVAHVVRLSIHVYFNMGLSPHTSLSAQTSRFASFLILLL